MRLATDRHVGPLPPRPCAALCGNELLPAKDSDSHWRGKITAVFWQNVFQNHKLTNAPLW